MTNALSKLDLSFLPDSVSSKMELVTLHHIWVLLGGVFAAHFVKWLGQYLPVRWQVRGLPTIHSAVEMFEAGHRTIVPHIPGITPRKAYTFDDPWKKYNDARSDLIACTQATTPYAVYITANPQLALSAQNKTAQFLKPQEMFRYNAIDAFGRQIVSVQNGAEHRRHRGVVKGCFNESIMRGVWEAMDEQLALMWGELGLENGGTWVDIEGGTTQLTLLIIGQIGFNQKWPWKIEQTDSKILPLAEALYVVEHSMFPQLVAPLWLLKYNPFASVRRLATAQESLMYHIKTMIKQRSIELEAEQSGLGKGEKIKPPSDVLGAIVASQMDAVAQDKLKSGDDIGNAGLTPSEIVGNIWIFIVAGHETSAHVLGFTLAYLALYPEHQDRIVQEVDEVTGGSNTNYRDMAALKYTLAVLHESVRLRDIVMTLPKVVGEDLTVPYTTWDAAGTPTTHTRFLKKGSHFIIDSPACQRNPFTWADAEVFRPERMFDEKLKGLSTGFAAGPRGCIGKRFAEVEMVCFLTHLCKQFRFSPIQRDGETRAQMEKRYLNGTEVLNLTPDKWDLKLTKRA